MTPKFGENWLMKCIVVFSFCGVRPPDPLTRGHKRSLVLAFGWAMASAVARAYNGGLGLCPQRGPWAEPLVRGFGGRSPPEAEHNYTFHKPIFAKFWCHFGKIQSFFKLLKLDLHVPWQFFRKHKRCCFDKLMYVGPQGRLSP